MITILRQRVACNIWVTTLKAKVTAWPCSKIVSGPKLCHLKSDFTNTFDKLLLCVQYLFGEHYPVPTGSCYRLEGVSSFNLYVILMLKNEYYFCHFQTDSLYNFMMSCWYPLFSELKHKYFCIYLHVLRFCFPYFIFYYCLCAKVNKTVSNSFKRIILYNGQGFPVQVRL